VALDNPYETLLGRNLWKLSSWQRCM